MAVAAVILLTILVGCGSDSPLPDAGSSKVVIIALDGVNWHTAAPLIERGEMPHLAAMTREGCWGSLDTLKPTWTPIIFTTMATGKLPQAHGVDSFIDANGIPLSSNMRRVKALWQMVSEADRKVVFVGWPVTWPAEEVNGVLLSENYGIHEEDHIYPPELGPELADHLTVLEQHDPDPGVKALLKVTRLAIKDLGGAELKGGKKGQSVGMEQPPRRRRTDDRKRLKSLHLGQVLDYIRAKLRLEKEVSAPYFIELVAREEPDLAAVYFAGTDMLQHICGARENPLNAAGVRPDPSMLSAVNEVYKFYDGIIGELKDGISSLPGYEDCLFIVLSDHGFDLDTGGRTFALRYRRPVEGSPLYPAGGASQNPGDGRDPLPRFLTEKSLWLDKPADPEVDLRHVSIFSGIESGTGEDQGWWRCRFDPRLDGPARYHVLNRLVHYGRTGLESRGIFITIAHDYQPPGIFVIHGGPVDHGGGLGDLSVDQVAPTVLALMGMAVAEDMAGGPIPIPLTGAEGKSARLAAPSLVATYDTEVRAADEAAVSSESDEKIRQQLRLMGYIE